MAPKAYQKAYQLLAAFPGAFWTSEREKMAAFEKAVYVFDADVFPAMTKIIIKHFGGWENVLKNGQLDKQELSRLVVRMDANAHFFQQIETEDPPLPAFMQGWSFDQLKIFYDGMRKTSRLEFHELLRSMDRVGVRITPDMPDRLLDSKTRPSVLDDIKATVQLQQGVYLIRNRQDYQKLDRLMQLKNDFREWFEGSQLEGYFPPEDIEVRFDLQLTHTELFEFMETARKYFVREYYHRGAELVEMNVNLPGRAFAQKILFRLIDDILKPMVDHGFKITNTQELRDAVTLWQILQNLRADIPISKFNYPQVFEKKLLGLNADWAGLAGGLEKNDAQTIMSLMDLMKRKDKQVSESVLQHFIAKNYGQFSTLKGMGDLAAVEKTRQDLNEISPELGDEFLILTGRNFIRSTPVEAGNIRPLLETALKWKHGSAAANRDVQELYGLIAYFIGNYVADFLELNRIPITKEVKGTLDTLGIARYRTFANGWRAKVDKFSLYMGKGDWRYLGSKLFGVGRNRSVGTVALGPAGQFQLPEGFSSHSVRDLRGREIAYVFAGDQARGAGLRIGFDVGYKNGGVSAKQFQEKNAGDKLVLDFPLGFTTGNGKPTDIAIQNGKVESWIMSMDRAHGLVIAYADGTMHIADKTTLHISELFRDPQTMPCPDRVLNLGNIDDYFLFIDIAKSEKLSVAANILLINQDKYVLIRDNSDSRRLLLEFSDGRIGVLNMNIQVSTAEATQTALGIQLPNGAKVVRAVYADTGYYDFATVHGRDKDTVLGHSDKQVSSNRIFIYHGAKGSKQAPARNPITSWVALVLGLALAGPFLNYTFQVIVALATGKPMQAIGLFANISFAAGSTLIGAALLGWIARALGERAGTHPECAFLLEAKDDESGAVKYFEVIDGSLKVNPRVRNFLTHFPVVVQNFLLYGFGIVGHETWHLSGKDKWHASEWPAYTLFQIIPAVIGAGLVVGGLLLVGVTSLWVLAPLALMGAMLATGVAGLQALARQNFKLNAEEQTSSSILFEKLWAKTQAAGLGRVIWAGVFAVGLATSTIRELGHLLGLVLQFDFRGAGQMFSEIIHSPSKLVRGTTVKMNWFARLLGWGVLGITAIVCLWIGLNAGIAAVPAIFILYIFTALSVGQFGFMFLEAVLYLRSPQLQGDPLLRAYAGFGSWKKVLIIALITLQLLGYLGPAAFLGYGTYLAKINYLGTTPQITNLQNQAAKNLLDPASEDLIAKYDPADQPKVEQMLKAFTADFSLKSRQRILDAVGQTLKAAAKRDPNQGVYEFIHELKQYHPHSCPN
jgi:hypothetical protein